MSSFHASDISGEDISGEDVSGKDSSGEGAPATSLDASALGHRVVVRRRLAPSELGARGESLTDVLGVLESVGSAALVVRRKDGSRVSVPLDLVVAAKRVPDRTVSRRDVIAVQRAAALGWTGWEVESLGDWLLRAGGGFTNRANSVVALGPADRPLPAALDAVSAWYASRGLRPVIQVLPRLHRELEALLARRDWEAYGRSYLMTGPVARLAAALGPDLVVDVRDQPSDAWLALYRPRGQPLPPHALRTIREAPAAKLAFLSASVDAQVLAIARAAVSSGLDGARWLGLSAVEVAEHARGRGLGTQVVAAAAEWGRTAGASQAYLQVTVGNAAAIALYEAVGLQVHHEYHYRGAPQPGGEAGAS